MADHGPTTLELVEVKAEDIMAERQSFYSAFLNATTLSIIATVVVMILMWIFVV